MTMPEIFNVVKRKESKKIIKLIKKYNLLQMNLKR
jgi:hypothetical protein